MCISMCAVDNLESEVSILTTCHEKHPMDVSLKHPPTHYIKEVSICSNKCFTTKFLKATVTIKFLKATVSDIVYFVFTDECNLFTTGTLPLTKHPKILPSHTQTFIGRFSWQVGYRCCP